MKIFYKISFLFFLFLLLSQEDTFSKNIIVKAPIDENLSCELEFEKLTSGKIQIKSPDDALRQKITASVGTYSSNVGDQGYNFTILINKESGDIFTCQVECTGGDFFIKNNVDIKIPLFENSKLKIQVTIKRKVLKGSFIEPDGTRFKESEIQNYILPLSGSIKSIEINDFGDVETSQLQPGDMDITPDDAKKKIKIEYKQTNKLKSEIIFKKKNNPLIYGKLKVIFFNNYSGMISKSFYTEKELSKPLNTSLANPLTISEEDTAVIFWNFDGIENQKEFCEFKLEPDNKSVKFNISYNGREITINSGRVYDIRVLGVTFSLKSSIHFAKEISTYNNVSDGFSEKFFMNLTPPDIITSIKGLDGYIEFTPKDGSILLPGQVLTVSTTIRLRNGEIVEGLEPSCRVEGHNGWVALAQQGKNIDVYLLQPDALNMNGDTNPPPNPPTRFRIVALAKRGDQVFGGSISIGTGQITAFAPVSVKFDVMDSRTVADLFGEVTSREYHVLNVRLYNNLKSRGVLLGNSILAYSSSMEIGVTFEKRYYKKDKSFSIQAYSKEQAQQKVKEKISRIQSILEEGSSNNENSQNFFREYDLIINDITRNYQQALRVYLDAIKTGSDIENSKQVLEKEKVKYQSAIQEFLKFTDSVALAKSSATRAKARQVSAELLSILSTFSIDDGNWYPIGNDDYFGIINEMTLGNSNSSVGLSKNNSSKAIDYSSNNQDVLEHLPVCNSPITYRPFTFEMVINTVDRREERSIRSRVFKYLNLAGSFFSAINAGRSASIAVANSKSETSIRTALDAYSNLLIPTLEKLFPSLKENYRQNIVSMVMKPVEEIPYGSDITRVVFIPKKGIHGLLSGNELRISEICPYYFKIEVAVISKPGVVQPSQVK